MYKKAPDFIIFFVVVTLLCIGVVMVFSSTSISSSQKYDDSFYFLKRQLMWSIVGIGVMIFFMRFDYHQYIKWAPKILLGSIALLILVLIPGIGKSVKGSSRWIDLGPLPPLQVSEIAKVSMVIYMSRFLALKNKEVKNFWKGLVPALFILGIVFALILMEPDLGTAVTIGGTVFVMLLASGARWGHLIGLGSLSIPAVFYMIITAPYRLKRLLSFLDPWKDPLGSGFHIIQSLYALGSGGLFGLGLGRSRQKFFYLPEPGTDFIFSVLGEELGFVGTSTVILLYFVFAWRGLQIALQAEDLFGCLISVGITTMITLQAMVNLAVVSGSMPVTGITLPFISYGGSSLVFMLAGVGILLNVSRFTIN
ncbi:cell division protein FtsW [Orenia metallireducens]|jgi:cell division protein FtsW|uniref:Cell division protein FtsW n=1 Tax=Orenia metallireducens TaxID=1413210 RepID=A0A285GVG3_9FIRM|nr:stage V sporulation protein E [Orenia metallireducens]PRX31116.1 cell division protein FtsW [Orenia metallireducens]SNY27502.1 cell division protein FtsW [Orenia metallireducens]